MAPLSADVPLRCRLLGRIKKSKVIFMLQTFITFLFILLALVEIHGNPTLTTFVLQCRIQQIRVDFILHEADVVALQ